MTQEQAQQVLDELSEVRPELLNDEAKRLFEAIMAIADERDELIKETDKLNKQIENLENLNKHQSKDVAKAVDYIFELNKEIELKDKVIDLMANHIATSDSNLCEYLDITNKCKYYAGENKKLCDDCIKQYFENIVKKE